MTGNTITNPIWMVKTRMQLLTDAASGQKAYNGYADAIRRIYAYVAPCFFWCSMRTLTSRESGSEVVTHASVRTLKVLLLYSAYQEE